MAYRATYKCRLCGQKFHGGSTGNEDTACKSVIELTSLGYSPDPRSPTMTAPHLCKTLSWGIADFQGWEKEE